MNRSVTCVVVLAVAAGAACSHRVTQPSTHEETLTRLRGWPGGIEGVVLRDGRTVETPGSAIIRVVGDSLLLVLREAPRVDTARIADVTHVVLRKTHVGRTVAAVVLVSAAAVAIIAVASEDEPDPPPQTSCPFIYAYNGNAYVAVAEPLGGAVSRGLQRTDVSRLEDLALHGGEYHLLLANEMREVQHLDGFSLLAVDHPEHTTVVADRAGNLYVSAAPVLPIRAVNSATHDLLPELAAADDEWWSARSGQARDTVTVSFPRPAQSNARLILHARTSRLGAHTLKAMLDLWGGEVDHWYALLDGSAAARKAHEEWVAREELWVLRVWVREASGWVPQDVAVGGGPYISELQAVTLDLSRIEGETLDIRFHPAGGFWDIDYVALDTARLAPPRVTELQITDADSINGQDVGALLRDTDNSYLVMSEHGQRIGLKFKAPPPAPGMTRTVFSRSTGFYRLETDRGGTRQAARLDSLWLQPGYGVTMAERVGAGLRQKAAR